MKRLKDIMRNRYISNGRREKWKEGERFFHFLQCCLPVETMSSLSLSQKLTKALPFTLDHFLRWLAFYIFIFRTCSKPFIIGTDFPCLDKTGYEGQNLMCPSHNGGFWHGCILVFVFAFTLCYFSACLYVSLCTWTHYIFVFSQIPHWSGREVPRDQNSNWFLAVRNTLLASPFKLHFRVWLPYSAKQHQWCQISGRKAKIKC